ncbi:hypothetical protein I3760_14G010000 [Carya illinoinensis]|uniref:protein LATERAL ROOT PRIMORDIUM 1-like isoform X2 n=1 Tax=Carya illinoinensis TaxID=32201 RepID=UPI001BF8C96A|nr:protein LATERAL ROOT PRIMORDIUM 1-like isoform X2 [Carya illinoinensis]KAG2668890.1 hypothetical protein I3760_14G010000 [Carya illinoinensis]
MAMLGLGDLVLIAPTTSMHQQNQYISADHQYSNPSLPSSAALGLGFGIFPLLTTTPCITAPNSNNPNYWSLEKGQELISSSNNFVNGCSDLMVTSIESGLRVCRDCGNKAKKDCNYRRCRTCCKSRGYDCATHVRSTWVPAARRRVRGVSMVGCDEGDGSSGSSSGVKRPRIEVLPPNITVSHASTSHPTTQRSTDASFKHSLPRQVHAKAEFRCHRVVAAVDKGEAECVYQATVSISGHLFKGFLYDQGVEDKNSFPCISQMQLESSSGGRNGKSSSIVSPSNAHPGSAS